MCSCSRKVSEDDTDNILDIMKKHPLGVNSKVIGQVIDDNRGNLYLETNMGQQKFCIWLKEKYYLGYAKYYVKKKANNKEEQVGRRGSSYLQALLYMLGTKYSANNII